MAFRSFRGRERGGKGLPEKVVFSAGLFSTRLHAAALLFPPFLFNRLFSPHSGNTWPSSFSSVETRVGISRLKRNCTLRCSSDLTARLLLIVGHALKNFTFTEIGSCENQKNFSRGEEVEELFRWIVSVSIVPLFSLHRFCIVICFLSKIRRVILYWLNSCSVVTVE